MSAPFNYQEAINLLLEKNRVLEAENQENKLKQQQTWFFWDRFQQQIHENNELIKSNQQEINTLRAKLPPPQKILTVPFLGWEFENSWLGSAQALGTIVGIPIGIWQAFLRGRVAWFKWRYSRVPYDHDTIQYYCRKFDLNMGIFKNPNKFMWREDAVQSGLYGAWIFMMIAWNRWTKKQNEIKQKLK